jgi:hypothetical protein
MHRETKSSPVARFVQAPDVLRVSPSSESLRDAFRLEAKRIQRQSDGTISLEGVRFEIPARYRHFHEVSLRYARWDLSRVDLVDGRSGTILAPIYPLDKAANADGRRAAIEPGGAARLTSDFGELSRAASSVEPSSPKSDMPTQERPRASGELPPLLKRILQEYSATGMPPAYLPKTSSSNDGEQAS